MRIRTLPDGREFEGTASQIVHEMRALAFGRHDLPLHRYISWIVEELGRLHCVDLAITGNTDGERATSLVNQLVQRGLAEQIAAV